MNRTFHARITVWEYLFLGLIGILTLCLLWYKWVLPAVFFMLCLIVYIEKLIHTTYTLAPDGEVRLHYGRFLSDKVIWVDGITAVRFITYEYRGWALGHHVRVVYDGKRVKFFPVNEKEFALALKELVLKQGGGNYETYL